MSPKRLLAMAAAGCCLTFASAAAPSPASAIPRGHVSPSPLVRAVSAEQGATWLASQLTSAGFIPSTTTPGQADLAATANTVLALASAGVDRPAAANALAYLEANVDPYVVTGGSDGPGQLSLLILDAHALGVDPSTFGGTDLVTRLLATERTSGPDAGLFGAQDPTYDGAYRQGLALAALAAVGVTASAQVATAEAWLTGQQCPDGGWTSDLTVANPCTGDPSTFNGPDTNSTALAVVGLEAQGALGTTAAANALAFLESAQDADAGWGYFPNTVSTPGSTDPDSTALVVQAIIALGHDPGDGAFAVGGSDPISVLAGFQQQGGAGAGAFTFPGTPGPDLLATYQAVPAMAGVALPFASTTVSAHAQASGASAAVTYSATVSSVAGTPTGTVTFASGGTPICTTAVLVGGSGTCTVPVGGAPAGATVDAVFTGSTAFGVSSASDGQGYWLVAADGGIFAYGDAGFFGSHGGAPLNQPIVGMASTADGQGYWLVAADGGIFAYGDAGFFGSHGGAPLNQPIVGMASTADGQGYWLVAADGGIFAYGDAGFFGSHGGAPLNQPIVGMASTADGQGYWLVAADGGIFAYGDAGFFGSHGGAPLNRPIVGMASTADGQGYWLVAADGGIFAYGDAGFFGSHGGAPLNQPIVGMASTADGQGYWLVAADGGIFAYGDAGFFGSHGGAPLNRPIVGAATSLPSSGG